jgi:hypothetical protein
MLTFQNVKHDFCDVITGAFSLEKEESVIIEESATH